jgi:hypothetical protein
MHKALGSILSIAEEKKSQKGEFKFFHLVVIILTWKLSPKFLSYEKEVKF